MKTFGIFLLLCLLLYGGFYFFPSPKTQRLRTVNQILNVSSRVMEKKYNIYTSGTGISMPNGVLKELTLAFDTRETYPKDELRKILIESANELLNQINANEHAQSFMEKTPFTIKDVQIIIYNHDQSGGRNFDPEVSNAVINSGILTFESYDPKNEFKIKNELKEPYEEALHIYENQKLKSGNF